MLTLFKTETLQSVYRKSLIWFAALFMALAGLMPILLESSAGAAELTDRSVTITSSQPSATGVSWDFDFDIPSDTAVQSIVFSFCNAALGTCTLPTGMNVGYATAAVNGTQTFTNATAFTEFSGANTAGCNGQGTAGDNTATTYCVTRTEALDETTAASKSITIDTITNPSIPSGNNTPVYVRIALYSDAAFATSVHTGTVVGTIVEQLTVTGRVAERLVFCAYALDDAAGSAAAGSGAAAMPTDCAATEANASTNVDIGVIGNSAPAVSPVDNNPPTLFGNDTFPAVTVNTNASNGVVVSYYSTQAGSGTEELRAFRVAGATCVNGGASLTDQCFISTDEVAGDDLGVAGEGFGIQLACVANNATAGAGLGTTDGLGAAGTGDGVTSGTYNAVYSADNNVTDDGSDDCENSDSDNPGAGDGYDFGWNDTATSQALINSAGVVDDEIVKMRFGARSVATTPTGTYTASTTFIATATF